MFFKSIYIFEIKYGIKIWTLANAKKNIIVAILTYFEKNIENIVEKIKQIEWIIFLQTFYC